MRTLLALACLACSATLYAADEVPLESFKLVGKDNSDPGESIQHNSGDGKIFFYIVGTAKGSYEAKDAGPAKLILEASCDEANNEKAKLKITVNGKVLQEKFELKEAGQQVYEFKTELKKGKNTIEIEFLNDLYKENEYDLNFYLHSVKFDKAS
jgi:hypothetical protein